MASEEARRGQLWWVEWERGRGSEQRGTRPALVIQNDTGNRYAATTIVAAVTTGGRALPVVVPVSASESGLPRDSFVNLAHILTVDKSRLLRRCGEIGPARMSQVDRAILVSLGVRGVLL